MQVTVTPSSRKFGAQEIRRHGNFGAQLQGRLHHRTSQQRIIGLAIVIADDGVESVDLEAVE